MTKHTQGPWAAYTSGSEQYSQYIAPVALVSWPYDVVAYIPEAYGEKCSFPGAHIANARLIAAAPELLEALNAIVQYWDEVVPPLHMNEMHKNAKAAIAKAAIAKA